MIDDVRQRPENFVHKSLEDAEVPTETESSSTNSTERDLAARRGAPARNYSELFVMSRCQIRFLIKQTLIAAYLNALFSAIAVWLVFRHMAIVPLYGSPSVIVDSIFQTFITTLMSILPPSILTAKWMLTRPDLTAARTSTARILIRAISIALVACLVSSIILPFAMPRLLPATLSFLSLLALKCLYGMAIGFAVTPFAVAAVMRRGGRGEGIESIDGL